MPLLTVQNLVFTHGTRRILDGVTFSIEPSERVGLVGRNGTGKTTLLRLIAGHAKPEEGRVDTTKNARVGYLVQDPDFGDATVIEAARDAFADLHRAQDAMEQLTHQMGDASGDELDRLMKRYSALERDVEHLGGYAIEHRVEETLEGLGFEAGQFDLKTNVLSGGQRSRLALAQLLLAQPDLILLDEPTNHLDIDGRRWLESFLADEFPGAVIVVSHDRYLLNRAVERILEVEIDGSLSVYKGNYDTYREQRFERKIVEMRAWEKQQDRVKSEEAYIRRYKAGQRAKQAAGREKRLERFKDTIADKPLELETMRLTLPKAPRSGDIVLEATNLSKRYDNNVLFQDVNLHILRGQRIGIIGPNGTGKSTLIKCLLNDTDVDSGTIREGANVSVGYYRQIQDHLDMDLTVWQYLQSVILSLDGATKASEQQARDLAGAFLFSGADQDKALGMLSGGERGRAVLAGIVAGGHNLLVLDEPTNHFDIPSAERLEQALDKETGFDGTLIVVSHDRALLDACVEMLIIINRDGSVRTFNGNYREWVTHEETQRVEAQARAEAQAVAEAEAEARAKAKKAKAAAPVASKTTTAKAGNQSAPAREPKGYAIKSLSKLNIKKLESLIEEHENRIKEIDALLLDSNVQRDGKRMNKLGNERMILVEDLEPLEFEWLRRSE